MYLSYDEYTDMGGNLDETAFDDFEFEASCQVDYWTFNRLKNDTEYPEALKRVIYKLIQTAEAKQNSLTAGNSTDGTGTAMVSSQSNDGVSVSWNVMSATQLFDYLKDETEDIIRKGLYGVRNELGQKVLYRGIYSNE